MVQYSILLPTYNERENLPICVWLIDKYLRKEDYEVRKDRLGSGWGHRLRFCTGDHHRRRQSGWHVGRCEEAAGELGLILSVGSLGSGVGSTSRNVSPD